MKDIGNNTTRLLQVLLMLLLVGVLATVAVAVFSGGAQQQEMNQTQVAIIAIGTALDVYANDCGQYPTSGQGLKALCTNPGVSGWKGPYLRQLPLDEWQQEMRYDMGNEYPRIRSPGRDGKFDTDDDVVGP